MQLLPGLDDELIETVIAYREIEDISNRAEIGEIIPFENMQQLSGWVDERVSNVYSIFVYPKAPAFDTDEGLEEPSQEGSEEVQSDPVKQAYMEIVEIINFNALPRVYKVSPYGNLPDTAPARVEEYGIELPLLN